MQQAAIEYHQSVFFGRHKPPFARGTINALVGDQSWPPALGRHECDGGGERVQRPLRVGRLNKVEVELVAVAVRTAMRPPLCEARTLGCGYGGTRPQPHTLKNLADAMRTVGLQVVAKREKSGSGTTERLSHDAMSGDDCSSAAQAPAVAVFAEEVAISGKKLRNLLVQRRLGTGVWVDE